MQSVASPTCSSCLSLLPLTPYHPRPRQMKAEPHARQAYPILPTTPPRGILGRRVMVSQNSVIGIRHWRIMPKVAVEKDHQGSRWQRGLGDTWVKGSGDGVYLISLAAGISTKSISCHRKADDSCSRADGWFGCDLNSKAEL